MRAGQSVLAPRRQKEVTTDVSYKVLLLSTFVIHCVLYQEYIITIIIYNNHYYIFLPILIYFPSGILLIYLTEFT